MDTTSQRQRIETFERDSREVARARRVVRDALHAWGHDADVGAFELLVSELVSNAVRHGSGPIELGLFAEGPNLRMEVADRGHGGSSPRLEEPGIGGWGLQFVDQLAESWGLQHGADGTRAWLVKRASDREATRSEGA